MGFGHLDIVRVYGVPRTLRLVPFVIELMGYFYPSLFGAEDLWFEGTSNSRSVTSTGRAT